MADKTKALRHIAFIMDGNGRWAKKRLMPREYGHKVGAETFKNIVKYCRTLDIEAVTVYAFSTENWKRPEREVNAIMALFSDYLDVAIKDMMKENVRIVFLGDKSVFPNNLRKKMEQTEDESKNNKYILNVGINYGGRDEIVNAVNLCIKEGMTKITEDDITERLYTKASPMPDLIVRTGGEYRISNFLMWQSAYSELYFTDVLWPDFSSEDVDRAIEVFNSRNRRYGGV
ncbi:MAG: di-trans,poly-cis-decaprenylcistransferase [Clostridia bacterium]|nr:di-trans,poly-cis-decaprenylcistransferase [Clostridia bacterium]